MKPTTITLLTSVLTLTACASTAPATPEPTQTASASSPLPYPEINRNEQFEQLAVQVTRLEQQISQLQARVQELEQQRPPEPKAMPPKPNARRVVPRQQTVSHKSSLKTPPPPVSPHASNTLQTAQKQYQSGNYHAVIHILRDADGGGNGSEHARQAMFLLLQSQQKVGNCQSVINIGQRYASLFNRHSSAASALFSVGECQWNIQQQDIAKDTWRTLIRIYPNSAAARLAEQRVK